MPLSWIMNRTCICFLFGDMGTYQQHSLKISRNSCKIWRNLIKFCQVSWWHWQDQHGNTWFGTIQFQVRTIQIQVVTRELQLGTVWFQGQDNKFRNSESVFCPKFRNYLVINILEAHSCELWFTHEKLQFSVILELSGTNLFGTREF